MAAEPVTAEPLPALVRVVQTCPACPSQWNAWDAAGQYYYLRYRGGRGTVETAASEQDYMDSWKPWSVPLVEFSHGGYFDGENYSMGARLCV